MLSEFNTTTITITIILGLIAYQTLYNLLFHPLRSIPGPLSAKITSKWLAFHNLRGYQTSTVHAAHKRYGPIVRLAPNELSFAPVSAIKDIYGQGAPFTKTHFYAGFEEKGLSNLFTARDKVFHAERRKLLGHSFGQKSILSAEPLVGEQITKFLQWLERKEGDDMNVFMWFRNLALDIVSSLFMGEEIGALNGDVAHEYLKNIDDYFMMAGLQLRFPFLLLLNWVPLPSWQHFLKAQDRLYDYGRTSFQRYIEKYGRDSKRNDPLKKILHGDATLPKLSDRETCTEIASILVAGTDTTSTVLTYTFWHLAKNPDLQDTLRQELTNCSVAFPPNGVPTYKDIERLQYLDAFTLEALRVYTAACASLPRAVPPQGGTVCEIRVPGGTTISTQSFTQHNNPAIFSSPERFLPERWITPIPGGTPEMKDAYIPFSRGPRGCPGVYLATMELKLILTSVIYMYQVGLGKRTTEDVMSRTDHFVLMPKGGFCDLVFTKV